jgi:uncharacterized protein YegP (UPF0339 family)
VYFAIYKSKPGAYWWVIKSDGNHETLVSSEILGSKQRCIDSINIVHQGAGSAVYYDRTGESA